MSKKKKILFAIDARELENIFKTQFGSSYRIADEVATHREAILDKINYERPDTVIIRETIIGSTPIDEVIFDIRKSFPNVQVVFITARDNPSDDLIRTLVNYGVYDFVVGEMINVSEIDRLIKNPNQIRDVSKYLNGQMSELTPKAIKEFNQNQGGERTMDEKPKKRGLFSKKGKKNSDIESSDIQTSSQTDAQAVKDVVEGIDLGTYRAIRPMPVPKYDVEQESEEQIPQVSEELPEVITKPKKKSKGKGIILGIILIAVVAIATLIPLPGSSKEDKDSIDDMEIGISTIVKEISRTEGVVEKLLEEYPWESDYTASWGSTDKAVLEVVLTVDENLYSRNGYLPHLDEEIEDLEYRIIPQDFIDEYVITPLDGTFYTNEDATIYYEHSQPLDHGETPAKTNKDDVDNEEKPSNDDVEEDDSTAGSDENNSEDEPTDDEDSDTVEEDSNQIPDNYVLADESHFQLVTSGYSKGTYNGTQGYYKYIGTESHIIIPKELNGEVLTDYYNMFTYNNTIRGVATEDSSEVSIMDEMFSNAQMPELELTYFDTTGVVSMEGMFYATTVPRLDLTMFDTSNVVNMMNMFRSNKASELDLSSFDTSFVSDTRMMFHKSNAKTVYTRTQEDANLMSTSSNIAEGINFQVK